MTAQDLVRNLQERLSTLATDLESAPALISADAAVRVREAIRALDQLTESPELETPFVPGKYKTRNGRVARVFLVDQDPQDEYPLKGAVFYEDGGWATETWLADGRCFGINESELDLLELPGEPEVWYGSMCEDDLVRSRCELYGPTVVKLIYRDGKCTHAELVE